MSLTNNLAGITFGGCIRPHRPFRPSPCGGGRRRLRLRPRRRCHNPFHRNKCQKRAMGLLTPLQLRIRQMLRRCPPGMLISPGPNR